MSAGRCSRSLARRGPAAPLSYAGRCRLRTKMNAPFAPRRTTKVGPIFESGPVSIVKGRPVGAHRCAASGRRRAPRGSARRSLRGVLEGDELGNDAVFSKTARNVRKGEEKATRARPPPNRFASGRAGRDRMTRSPRQGPFIAQRRNAKVLSPARRIAWHAEFDGSEVLLV